jgi:NADP-dependent 3-hydroxy acid dehydrogenase YdfG
MVLPYAPLGQALVVGASSTIGTAIAVELAGLGHRVTLWGRDQGRLDVAADSCSAVGPPAVVDLVDVTEHVRLADHLAVVTARGPLQVVVWAAGLFDWALADEADPATWARLLDVNLVSAAVLTPLALPHLVAAAPSALVYLGSGAAHTVYRNNAAYVASKHGLAALARATFLDVQDHDVKVSLVSPGLVAAGGGLWSPAGQTRPQELLQPEDVAAAVRFVVTFPSRGCPTEIRLQPQRSV